MRDVGVFWGGDTFAVSFGVRVGRVCYLTAHRRYAESRKVEAAPTIDGVLDDAHWQRTSDLTDLMVFSFDRKPSVKTDAWVAHDAEHLYFAARCHEPHVDQLQTKVTVHDGAVWNDDGVELLFDVTNERESFVQWLVNAAGVVHDTAGPDSSWSGPMDHAVGRESGAWTIEIAIPWTSLGMEAPADGRRVCLQFVRNRLAGRGSQEILQWAPSYRTNLNPAMFGELTFRE